MYHQRHSVIIIGLTPTHIITIAAGTGHTPSITDAAKGTTLIGQDHAIDPSMIEAPVTTGGMHPTLYPVTIAILSTPLQTGTLKDIPVGIPHTATGTTSPDTHHTEATPDTTSLITVSLAPGTPWALPMDYTEEGH